MKPTHVDIDAYMDDRLDSVARAAAVTHLSECGDCAHRLEDARRMAAAVASQPVPDPGDVYWQHFAARVESRLEPRRANAYERLFGWLMPSGRWAAVRAATAVAVACLVVYVGMRGFRPPDLRPREIDLAPPQSAPPPPVTPPIEPPGTQTTSPPAQREADVDARKLAARGGDAADSKRELPLPRRPRDNRDAAEPLPPSAGTSDGFAKPPPPQPEPSDSPAPATRSETETREQQAESQSSAPAVENFKARGDAQSKLRDAPAARDADANVEQKRNQAPPAAAPTQDPIAVFVDAAVAGDTATARAAAARVGDERVARSMRRWLDAPAKPTSADGSAIAPPHAASGRRDAAPLPSSLPPAGSARGSAPAPAPVPWATAPTAVAGTERWLILESLAWPRRDDVAMRPALSTIAHVLAAAAPSDARAAQRARALVAHLVATSADVSERTQWQSLLRTLP